MERCVIVDYGFLQSQLSHSPKPSPKRAPSEPQSHQYLRKVRPEHAELTESSDPAALANGDGLPLGLIRERTLAGIARAGAEGKYKGRASTARGKAER